MLHHALEQADVPAAALLAEVAQPLGHLRPADRIRRIADPVGEVVLAAEDMQLDDQLHILAHRVMVIPARVDHQIFLEQAERAGDNDVAVELIEQDARCQKGTVVFEHLHAGDQIVRHAVADHMALLDLRAVAGADRAADCNDVVALQNGAHDLFQRVALQHGVCVDAQEIREVGCVDAHVQRVRLAAVALADQRDRDLVAAGFIDRFLRLAVDAPLDRTVDLAHAERLLDHAAGFV